MNARPANADQRLLFDGRLRAVIEASVTWVTYDPIVVRLPVFDGDVTEVAG